MFHRVHLAIRNQLNRKDSITSISNIHGRRSSSNIGGRDVSPVSIDNELGGKLDQEEAVNVSSFSNVHSESSLQQQQLSSTVKKIRRKTFNNSYLFLNLFLSFQDT